MHINLKDGNWHPYRFDLLKALSTVNPNGDTARIHHDALTLSIVKEIVKQFYIPSVLTMQKYSVGINIHANRFYLNIHVLDVNHNPHVLYLSESLC